MGSRKKPKMEVTEYRLSMHVGICVGPIDEVKAIYIDEKVMWQGSATNNTVLSIDKKSLFGGVKEEGGVSGQCYILMGGNGQTMPNWLASKLPGNHVPGFRGLCSLFFTGFPGSRRGFYWTANSPYIKEVWVKVRHVPGGLNAGYAEFPDGSINPAHVIYEAMTRTELGMGEPSYKFDHDAWNAAAQTLWNENLGVAFAWMGQIPVEDIVRDMQDHIDGWVFQHPRTGLWTLKLVRGDYDQATLPVIDPDVAILSNFQRKGLGETVNEIVVTYTNPGTEKEETVTVHDLGNIAAQGALVSDSRNYYGIRSPDIAAMLGQRDIRIASTPLCACEAVLNRKFWNLVPGDVVKLTWPDYGLNELVMRVGKVDYGLPGNQAIKVSLVEDIFASPAGSYVAPPSTGWVDPSRPPRPVAANTSIAVTLPAYMLLNIFDDGVEEIDYPEVRSGTLVTQNDDDTFEYGLVSYLSGPSSALEWVDLGTLPTLGYGELGVPLNRESITTGLVLDPIYGTTYPDIDFFIWIGNPSNFDESEGAASFSRAELCLISGGDGAGWTVMRGVLDTQPLEWPAGTPFWVLDPNVDFDDGYTVRAAGESALYKALPMTSQGMLDIAQAPTFSRVLSARPHLPLRPANVRLNGIPWGDGLTLTALDPLTVTWSNRNRLSETALVLKWDDATVPPESGSEVIVELYDGPPDVTSPVLSKVSANSPINFTASEISGISIAGNVGWSVYSRRGSLDSFSRVAGSFTVEVEATVAFVRAGTQVNITSDTSLTAKLPDLDGVSLESSAIFMVIMHRSDLTAPTGWSLVESALNPPTSGTPTQRTTIYRKDLLESDDSGANSTWEQQSANRMYLQSLLFTCTDENFGIAVAGTGASAGAESGYIINVPVLTADGGGECFIMAASYITSSSGTAVPPVGSTLVSPSSISGLNNRLLVAYQNIPEGGASGGFFRFSNTQGTNPSAITVRLQPVEL